MERLWAPWRNTYVASVADKPDKCLFCRVLSDGHLLHKDNFVLHEEPYAFAMLNRYPYNTGHVMIAPRRHVATPSELPIEEAAALDALLRRFTQVIQSAYQPHGMNLGMNLGRPAGAGIPDHCHWHIVPRWNGDTNFMPVVGMTKVLSESLDASFERIRALLL